MIELSTGLNQLFSRLKTLQDQHAFRYLHFVNNSPRGTECTYARISEREHLHNRQELLDLLQQIEELAQQCQELEDKWNLKNSDSKHI